jgi:hypothetical protein
MSKALGFILSTAKQNNKKKTFCSSKDISNQVKTDHRLGENLDKQVGR